MNHARIRRSAVLGAYDAEARPSMIVDDQEFDELCGGVEKCKGRRQ